MGVGGDAIGYVVSVSITCRLRSYLPPQRCRLYCPTCLTGYLFWEKTTFCNIVHVPYHPRVVDRHIIVFIVTKHSSMPTRKRWWRSDPLGLLSSLSSISKSLLVKFSLSGLSTPDGPRFSHSPSIAIGFDYLRQSPCSALLFYHTCIWLEFFSLR